MNYVLREEWLNYLLYQVKCQKDEDFTRNVETYDAKFLRKATKLSLTTCFKSEDYYLKVQDYYLNFQQNI